MLVDQFQRPGSLETILKNRLPLGGRIPSLDTLLPDEKMPTGAELTVFHHPNFGS